MLAQDWIATSCGEFIGKDEWPPNAPNINLLDYHNWGVMDRTVLKSVSSFRYLAFENLYSPYSKTKNNNSKLAKGFEKALRLCVPLVK